MVVLTIINESPRIKRQVRARELELSKIRSHAARASHQIKAKQAAVSSAIPEHLDVSNAGATTSTSRAWRTRRPTPTIPFIALDRSENETSEQEIEHGAIWWSQGSEKRVQYLHPEQNLQVCPCSHWRWGHGLRQDPFDCIPGSRFGKDALALDLLLQIISPAMNIISEAFGVSNIYGPWLLEQMALFRDFYHAMMAMLIRCQTRMTQTEDISSEIDKHKISAIRQLRKRLSVPGAIADDGAILTIVFLAIFEELCGDRNAYQLHSRQVKAMVTSKGGLSQLQPGTAVQAVVAQFRAEALTPVELRAKACTYAPRPLTEEHLSIVVMLPAGFRELALGGVLSNQTIDILIRASQNKVPYCLPVSECHNSSQFWDYYNACPGLSIPDGPDGPSLERMICLGLIRYCFNVTYPERDWECLPRCMIIHLFNLMPLIPVPVKVAQRRCLLWVWLMCIDSWSNRDANLTLEGITLLRQISLKFPETTSWTAWDFDKLGADFFWTDGISIVMHKYWGDCHRQSWKVRPWQSIDSFHIIK